MTFNLSASLPSPLLRLILGSQRKVEKLAAFLADDWLLVATLDVMPDHSVLEQNNFQFKSVSATS